MILSKPSGVKSRYASTEEMAINYMSKSYPLHREGGRIFPSEANCDRRVALYGLVDQIEPMNHVVSPEGLLYMDYGSSAHKTLTNAFYLAGKLLFKEYHLPKLELNLGGYVDAIILDFDDRIRGVEIKTCGAKTFKLMPSEIKDEHRKQAAIYSVILGLDFKVLYVSRDVKDYAADKLLIKSIPLVLSDEEKEETIVRLVVAHLAMNDNKLPPIPFSSAKECGFCPFTNLCWSEWGKNKTFAMEADEKSMKKYRKGAEQIARKIIDDTPKRRNGILNHISRHGTPDAKRLLGGSWENLF